MMFFITTMLAMDCETLILRTFKGLCILSCIEVVAEVVYVMAIFAGVLR